MSKSAFGKGPNLVNNDCVRHEARMIGRFKSDNAKLQSRPHKVSLRVHASSWISWLSYALAFCLTVVAEPQVTTDLRQFEYNTHLLLASVAIFFIAVTFIQWQMNLALKAHRFDEPEHLVSSGAFAYSRNPMYVCFLLPLGAWALWSPLSAIVAMIAYVVAMNLLVIRREEADLRAAFGPEYEDYAARVPRWLLSLSSVRARRFTSQSLTSADASNNSRPR